MSCCKLMVNVVATLLIIRMQYVVAMEEFTSIVFIAKLCYWRQSQNKTSFERFYFGDVANMMSVCSKNNIHIGQTMYHNIVVDVDIPCKFASPYNSSFVVDNFKLNSSNTYDYLYHWMDFAINSANNTLKGTIDNYKHKLLVLPKNNVIPWRALGTLGDTLSWYNTQDFDASVYLHELGHNFGFGHAMKNGQEYGDTTCVMGTGSNCYTSPHRHSLLWDKPILTLNWYASFEGSTNTSVMFKNDGDYLIFNNNLFVETNADAVQVYILQPNMSTSHICALNEQCTFCDVPGFNVSIIFVETTNNQNSIMLQPYGTNEHLRTDIRNQVPYKNDATTMWLSIYEKWCLAFITFNIVQFLIHTFL